MRKWTVRTDSTSAQIWMGSIQIAVFPYNQKAAVENTVAAHNAQIDMANA